MVHGIRGTAADWKFGAEQFVKTLPDKVIVHCSCGFDTQSIIYGSYNQLLDDPCGDVVYMPLPTSLRLHWAVLAVRKKKHLLLEKPTALDVSELDQTLEAWESNGVQFMDGSMWLHHPRTAKLKDLVSDPKLSFSMRGQKFRSRPGVRPGFESDQMPSRIRFLQKPTRSTHE
ncbi:hypothetical protein ACFXTH_014198 [Malus domestica]